MRIELPVPGSKERTQPVNLRQRIEYYRAYRQQGFESHIVRG